MRLTFLVAARALDTTEANGHFGSYSFSVGVRNLAYEFGPTHIHGSIDFAGLRSRIVLEDFHHQGCVVREDDARL
jgi:hypothetical protein